MIGNHEPYNDGIVIYMVELLAAHQEAISRDNFSTFVFRGIDCDVLQNSHVVVGSVEN
jgi:hypothetical protein